MSGPITAAIVRYVFAAYVKQQRNSYAYNVLMHFWM